MIVSLRFERDNHVVIMVLALKNDRSIRRYAVVLVAGSLEVPDKAFYDRRIFKIHWHKALALE